MCGIVGIVSSKIGGSDSSVVVRNMLEKIAHRGPDNLGLWQDPAVQIYLGHRRLSIQDLSEAGNQPMLSPTGRYVIIYNGEIYNHLELRSHLGEENWRGHSDTETLLRGFEKWGIKETICQSVGMFAIVVWDREERALHLVRDRVGEKPLYYGWQGQTMLFGSELKALKAHPDFRGEIDTDSLSLYMRHGYIVSPYSIYKGIHELMPGTILSLSESDRLSKDMPEPLPYWSLSNVVSTSKVNMFTGTVEDAVLELEKKLLKTVQGQMLSDVPIGAFLSGGIDSSTIVALMQSQSTRPIKTFTIGFHEAGYNEAVHANAVARHLGTDHTELYVRPEELMDIVYKLPSMYDEPMGDSSAIPTYLVSKLAKEQVTVSLSGDGGDELFGGYRRYSSTEYFWSKLSRIPYSIRNLIAPTIKVLSHRQISPFIAPVVNMLRNRPGFSISERIDTLVGALRCKNMSEYYRSEISMWRDPALLVLNGQEPLTALTDHSSWPQMDNLTERMMYADMRTYLPGDILTKVDRAAMAVSLETRVPLLDHRIIEFAWSLPFNYKIRDGLGKHLLREVLYKYVPRELVDRPKMGFGVPVDVWLRGPFREWAEDLLSEDSLRRQGLFNPAPIRERLRQHLAGEHNWKDSLWSILCFQAWMAGR